MPHINLLYPFLPDFEANFPDAAEKMKSGLAKIPPFKMTFSKDSFGYFSHRKSATLWLKPAVCESTDAIAIETDLDTKDSTEVSEASKNSLAQSSHCNTTSPPQHQQVVLDLQSELEELFPDFKELGTISELGFQPHLSLGQFKPKEVENARVKFQQDWSDISFDLKEIYLISRADYDDPFHIRHTVPLGTDLAMTS